MSLAGGRAPGIPAPTLCSTLAPLRGGRRLCCGLRSDTGGTVLQAPGQGPAEPRAGTDTAELRPPWTPGQPGLRTWLQAPPETLSCLSSRTHEPWRGWVPPDPDKERVPPSSSGWRPGSGQSLAIPASPEADGPFSAGDKRLLAGAARMPSKGPCRMCFPGNLETVPAPHSLPEESPCHLPPNRGAGNQIPRSPARTASQKQAGEGCPPEARRAGRSHPLHPPGNLSCPPVRGEPGDTHRRTEHGGPRVPEPLHLWAGRMR